MTTLDENSNSLWRTLFGRRRVEITGYQAGDVRVSQPLFVAGEGVLAGNVMASRVRVEGLVYGTILAQELVVGAGGQVWGDVYAITLQVEDGGGIHGWVHTLRSEAYDALMQNGLDVDQLPLPEDLQVPQGTLPPELENDASNGDYRHVAVLRQLQAETGAALAARKELEQKFEERVAEVAAGAFATVEELQAKLQEEQDVSRALDGRLGQANEAIAGYEIRLEDQTNEITQLRAELRQQAAKLEKISVHLDERVVALAAADTVNQQLQERLNERIDHADALASRVESLESALQASVQHSAEQEEALLRWQELAEVTQEQVGELESRLDALNLQLEESQHTNELLRAQQAQAEQEWTEAENELAELRQELERRPEPPPANEQVLAEARQALTRLETDLTAAREEIQDLQDQLLWYKMSLKTTTTRLQAVQEQEQERQQLLEMLKAEAAERQELAEQWKSNVGRLSELLYEAEKRLQQRDQQVQTLQAELAEARTHTELVESGAWERLQQKVREQAVQIEALEAEADHYHRELEGQSQRLAEIRAVLAEQEVARRELQQQLEKRAEEIEMIKKLATKRIRALESALADSRRKLQDLITLIERRRRQG